MPDANSLVQASVALKPAEEAEGLSIRGPETYLCNKVARVVAKEVAFWGYSTPGMQAASRYR